MDHRVAVFAQHVKHEQGFTRLCNGVYPDSGFIVVLKENTSLFIHDDDQNVNEKINAWLTEELPANGMPVEWQNIGGWYDSENGWYVLSPVLRFNNRNAALRHARREHQRYIFDLSAKESIPA